MGLLGVVALGAIASGCATPGTWSRQLISAASTGAGTANDFSVSPVFSADGTKVAFESRATNLGPADGTPCNQGPPLAILACTDIYVRDLTTGATTLVSVNSAGTGGGNSASNAPVFSPDGTKVAFISWADNLVAGDSELCGNTTGIWSCRDVFVRDLTTGVTTLVSKDADDGVNTYANSSSPVFSPNGADLTFVMDSNPYADPTVAGRLYTWHFASQTLDLTLPDARNAVFSPDSSQLAFVAARSSYGIYDSNGYPDVYVKDLTTGAVSLVSVNAAGIDSALGQSDSPSFSPDGTQILFSNIASGAGPDMGPVDTNAKWDLYLRDLSTGTTELVSTNALGTDSGNDASSVGSFSPDGTKVLFHSAASDLGPNDTNSCTVPSGPPWPCMDVYLRDLTAGTTTLVSVNAAGTDSGNQHSTSPRFLGDGSKVVFTTRATNLGPNDTATCPNSGQIVSCSDIYVRDLVTGTTTLVTTNADGSDSANDNTFSYVVAHNRVGFNTRATNLGVADANGAEDVFLSTLN